MAGYRPNYTLDEEKAIFDYIVSNKEFYRLKGDKVWKNMEEEGITNRSWQSLKQHFKKTLSIKMYYPHFGLSEEHINLIQCCLNSQAEKLTASRQHKQKSKQVSAPRKRQPLESCQASGSAPEQSKRIVADLSQMSSSSSDSETQIDSS